MHRRRIDFEDERHRVKCNDQKQQEINAAGTSSLSLSLGRAPSIFVSFRVYLFRQVRVCVCQCLTKNSRSPSCFCLPNLATLSNFSLCACELGCLSCAKRLFARCSKLEILLMGTWQDSDEERIAESDQSVAKLLDLYHFFLRKFSTIRSILDINLQGLCQSVCTYQFQFYSPTCNFILK